MQRDIEKDLKQWKSSPRRKPLILNGARQVGKTYSLLTFGRTEYDQVAYFNFEETPNLTEIFQGELNTNRILETLSVLCGFIIKANSHLIILDEIQLAPDAITALKYFSEKAPEFHIVTAGSLLGIHLSKPKSFPVGKVNFLELYPLSFSEYLQAIGKQQLDQFLRSNTQLQPLPTIIHEELIHHLRHYFYIGGMPEAVYTFIETNDFHQVRVVQKEILRAYQIDFSKHPNHADIPKISRIWESIPTHLAKENKKFIFSRIRSGARAREYENALQWLMEGGLILKARNISKPNLPLSSYADSNIFKVYLLDTGILGTMSNLSAQVLTKGSSIFEEFKGSLTENYVAQQLVIYSEKKLYYWTSAQTAEVDFLHESEEAIFPIEVKAGLNTKSKSLQVYRSKYSASIAIRSNLRNLEFNGDVLNIPLYAINYLSHFLTLIESK